MNASPHEEIRTQTHTHITGENTCSNTVVASHAIMASSAASTSRATCVRTGDSAYGPPMKTHTRPAAEVTKTGMSHRKAEVNQGTMLRTRNTAPVYTGGGGGMCTRITNPPHAPHQPPPLTLHTHTWSGQSSNASLQQQQPHLYSKHTAGLEYSHPTACLPQEDRRKVNSCPSNFIFEGSPNSCLSIMGNMGATA